MGKNLKITCKKCHKVFYNRLQQPQNTQKKNKYIIPAVIFAIIIAFIWYNKDSSELKYLTFDVVSSSDDVIGIL